MSKLLELLQQLPAEFSEEGTTGRDLVDSALYEVKEDLVKSIVEWVTINAQMESIFLTPEPNWTVDAHALLDQISILTGIRNEQIGQWVQSAQESIKNG
jgi:hypothetical protein